MGFLFLSLSLFLFSFLPLLLPLLLPLPLSLPLPLPLPWSFSASVAEGSFAGSGVAAATGGCETSVDLPLFLLCCFPFFFPLPLLAGVAAVWLGEGETAAGGAVEASSRAGGVGGAFHEENDLVRAHELADLVTDGVVHGTAA